MDVLKEVTAKFKELDLVMIKELTNFHEANNPLERFLEATKRNVAAYKKNRDASVFEKQIKEFTTKAKGVRKKKITASAENSLKENTPLETTVKTDIEEPGRPRRRAFNEASQIMNTQRRTTRNTKISEFNPSIKLERLSNEEGQLEKIAENKIIAESKIKVEMPPPAAPPVKRNRKKKETDSLRTTSSSSVDSTRPSDVIIQKEEVVVVNLADEDDDIDAQQDESTKRSTKRKTKKQKEAESAKRFRSPSVEKKRATQKRTKRKKSSPDREVESSTYEDASEALDNAPTEEGETATNKLAEQFINQPTVILEQLPQKMLDRFTTVVRPNTPPLMNATVVLSKNTPPALLANQTVTIERVNKTMVISKTPVDVAKEIADLMTDDESINEEVPKKPIKTTKPIFSPFTNSPVKKRVEAFEKLQQQTAADDPTRVTRTKSRLKAKKEGHDEEIEGGRKLSQIPVKDKKSTMLTPTVHSRYLPSASQSAQAKRFGDSTENLAVPKSTSALKATQQEFRERERKRKEKEAEAMRKKEALMQLKIEQKKRLREEKELKAKQQREALEKEKMKMAEMQARQKEERQKQLILEKQEKQSKEREEIEKKRLLVKQKYEEKKREEKRRAEEERRLAEEAVLRTEKEKAANRVRHDKGNLPIYMINKAPLLPTYDCYDSDEENKESQIAKPSWVKREYMTESNILMNFVKDRLKNTFFCLKPQTPDLRQIFQNIDPKKLKRNSSALWSYQPRFTIMPSLSEEDY